MSSIAIRLQPSGQPRQAVGSQCFLRANGSRPAEWFHLDHSILIGQFLEEPNRRLLRHAILKSRFSEGPAHRGKAYHPATTASPVDRTSVRELIESRAKADSHPRASVENNDQ